MDLAAASTRTRNPALDGLRGFALAGMLAWHAQIGWVAGGFARMTIFFVLSGFLATRSHLRRPGRGFVAFWARRTVRLLPITLVGVGAAIATTVLAGTAATRASLAGDAASVLTYTSNFRFLADDQTYGGLFERASAFQHFWSLSIEEQAFVLLPVVLAGAAWLTRRFAIPARTTVGAAALLLLSTPLVIAHTPDQAYFGTHIRLGEFLAGAWLAFALHGRPLHTTSERVHVIRWMGRASVPLLAIVMVTIDRDEQWLYRGGMAVFVVPAVAVVAAAVTADPWLDRTLGVLPLRLLGRWALSVYALHWPIYLLCDRYWPGMLDRRFIVPAELTIAVVVGAAVHYAVERPLLPRDSVTARPRRRHITVPLPTLAAVGVVLAVVAVAVPPLDEPYDFAAAERIYIERSTASTVPVMPDSAPPRRIGVFGGSTALQNGLGLPAWADGSNGWAAVTGEARLGCGILTSGERTETRTPDGTMAFAEVPSRCDGWSARWTAAASTHAPEVAVVFFGIWEMADWRLDDEQIVSLGDPEFDAAVVTGLHEAVAALRRGGVDTVVLATVPKVSGGASGRAPAERGLDRDTVESRYVRFNQLIRLVALDMGATVWEYGAAVDGLRPDEMRRLVPDGVHPTWEAAISMWRSGLGDDLERLLTAG